VTKASSLERAFAVTWQYAAPKSAPAPVTQHRFLTDRQFRFDFAWPQYKVAVEIEGGIYGKGGHNSINGFIKDCEKYNQAVLAGWRVLRYTERCLTKRPVQVVEEVIAALKGA
jgi:very-short-patch-repair endonuclease